MNWHYIQRIVWVSFLGYTSVNNSFTGVCVWGGEKGGGKRWGIPCPLQPGAAQRDLTVPDVRLWETEAGLVSCTVGGVWLLPWWDHALGPTAGWQQNLGFSPCSASLHFLWEWTSSNAGMMRRLSSKQCVHGLVASSPDRHLSPLVLVLTQHLSSSPGWTDLTPGCSHFPWCSAGGQAPPSQLRQKKINVDQVGSYL